MEESYENDEGRGNKNSITKTLAYLCAVVLTMGIVLDHTGGFVHHYDIHSQIEQLQALQETVDTSEEDLQRRIDALKRNILEGIEKRQSEASGKTQLEWTSVSARIAFVLLVLLGLVGIGKGAFFREEQ
jgi:hypothetical protein